MPLFFSSLLRVTLPTMWFRIADFRLFSIVRVTDFETKLWAGSTKLCAALIGTSSGFCLVVNAGFFSCLGRCYEGAICRVQGPLRRCCIGLVQVVDSTLPTKGGSSSMRSLFGLCWRLDLLFCFLDLLVGWKQWVKTPDPPSSFMRLLFWFVLAVGSTFLFLKAMGAPGCSWKHVGGVWVEF